MNERDLHTSLGDLARRTADEQSTRQGRGDGLSVPAITRQSGRARRRRGALSAVGGVAAVTAVLLAGATLTDRPEPRPASTPSPSATRPAPTPTPSGSATSEPTETADDTGTTGVLRPYATAPRTAWTTSAGALWTGTPDTPGAVPVLGDVTASPHSYPGFRALAAGGTWLVAAGIPVDEDVVGVRSADGAVRWSLDGAEDAVDACAGVHDGLLVCLGAAGPDSTVQLRDPATGDVVREAGPGGAGVAVADGAVVVHAVTGDDVRIEVRDLTSGAVRGDVVLAGAAGAEVGDGVVQWQRAGTYVLVHAPRYSFAVDARTGQRVGSSLARPVDVRPDGWVTGYGSDGSLRAEGPDGEGVALPGELATTPAVWAPAAGLPVPLLVAGYGDDARVHAVDPTSGQVVWSVPGAAAVQAVAGRTAVLLGQDDLVAVDVVSGAELWRTPAGTVVGVDGERLVVDDLAGLRAVDVRDGSVVWELALDPTLQVHALDGTLVAVGADGSLSSLVP